MGGVLELIEPEVRELLDDHKKVLENHDGRIVKLETTSQIMDVKFSNIETQLTRIESASIANTNALLASNSSIAETLQKVVEGNIANNTNKKDVIIKTLTVVGSIVGLILLGVFAAKGIKVTIPIF
jgi:hypothetical protein